MKNDRVREPVQVYLEAPDRERLEWLTAQLGATKSDVLRRALQALERDVANPDANPLLLLSGIGTGDRGPRVGYDPALEHDRYLAEVSGRVAETRRGPARTRRPQRRRAR